MMPVGWTMMKCRKCRKVAEHYNERCRVCLPCQAAATKAARQRRSRNPIPFTLRKAVEADFVSCFYCGEAPDPRHNRLELDHVVPLELGGKSVRRNLVMACRRCNRMKGHKRVVEFVRYTRERFTWWWPHRIREAQWAVTRG